MTDNSSVTETVQNVIVTNQQPNVTVTTAGTQGSTVTQNVQNVIIANQQPNVIVAAVGPQGPAGPSGSSAVFYVFTQATPSATWTINHNLQGNPTAVVMDSAGTMCEGSFSYPTQNQMLINFSAAFSGTAYII